MYLIRKGKPPKPICRVCGKLHSQRQCPRWVAARKAADEFYRWVVAYQEQLKRA